MNRAAQFARIASAVFPALIEARDGCDDRQADSNAPRDDYMDVMSLDLDMTRFRPREIKKKVAQFASQIPTRSLTFFPQRTTDVQIGVLGPPPHAARLVLEAADDGYLRLDVTFQTRCA